MARLTSAPTPKDVWKVDLAEELQRILESARFRRADNLQRLLRFIVTKSASGAKDNLKEYVIGMEVFGRPENFDPRIDAIVRVQVGRLRTKLEAYYRSEGRCSPLMIEIPRGSYTPLFHSREMEADTHSMGVASIAVLPLFNLITNKETRYVADALTEEIIDRLSRSRGVRVTPWVSVLRFKQKACDLKQITRQLSVKYLMEGSIRRIGSTLRVKARLLDSESNFLWCEQYEQPDVDLYTAQEAISSAIVAELEGRIGLGHFCSIGDSGTLQQSTED
jgi:TolB-like protein